MDKTKDGGEGKDKREKEVENVEWEEMEKRNREIKG